jgi:hypothetical protein
VAASVLMARPAGAVCVGDCNADAQVLINEIVNSVNIFLETSPLSSCTNADQNGDGKVLINEVVAAVNSFADPTTCLQVGPGGTATPTVAGATPTPPPPTATAVAPTATAAATNTLPPATSTPTPTQPAGAAVCGNGFVDAAAGEECDNGGICIGGTNAGTVCDAESDCQGEGVCIEGPKVGTACSANADCPGSVCIHCKPFGGDGCAANCTNETDIPYKLVPGAPKVCDAASGVKAGNACSLDTDCSPGKCAFIKLCLGGANDGLVCANNTQCPGGQCLNQFKPGTTGSFVHDGFIQLALPLVGKQVSTVGKLRNGKATSVIKSTASKIDRVAVGALACACVRSVEAKTCGGTLFDADGTISDDCSAGFTAGDSVCTGGKKPCAYVHGPGNSSSGFIGCGPEGLEGINLTFTQDANLSPLPYPPPATPPPGSSDPVIVLSGTGPPGSGIILNSSAIGTATGVCDSAGVKAVSGPDQIYCTDDDPQSSRGTPQTLPQLTGTATGLINNTNQSTQPAPNNKKIGPFGYTGTPYDCAKVGAALPSLEGGAVAGAFTSLNQPTTGDIVVRNVFVPGPRCPTNPCQ